MSGNVTYADEYEKITDETVISDALVRIVDSPEFRHSNRSKQLLQYIVGKFLDGDSHLINGITIAQDVLGYGSGFDPSTNPVVRVQAGRLRKCLARYYRRTGKDDKVFIYVAKGQYAPEIGRRNSLKPIQVKHAEQQIVPKKKTRWRVGGIVAGIVTVFLIVFALRSDVFLGGQKTALERTIANYPGLVILPFENLTGEPDNDVFKQGFQHQLASDLYQFRVVKVALANDEKSWKSSTKADYSLAGTLLSVDEEIDLIVRLKDLKTGDMVKQHRIARKINDDSYFNALVDISSKLSSQFAGPEGVLVEQSLDRIRRDLELENHAHANIESFGCLALFHQFERDKTLENFEHAEGCLRHQVNKTPDDSTLLSALAWITAYGSPGYPMHLESDLTGKYSLTKALEMAERAVALDPGNYKAYEYVSLMQWQMGNKQAAIQSIRRSIQLNPAAPSLLANLGQYLTYTGNWEEGLERAREAIARHPDPPYRYYTPLYFRAVLDRDAKKAVLYADKHDQVGGQDVGAFSLIAAHIAGNDRDVEKFRAQVEKYAREHGGDPLFNTRRWTQSKDIITALETELKDAGVSVQQN